MLGLDGFRNGDAASGEGCSAKIGLRNLFSSWASLGLKRSPYQEGPEYVAFFPAPSTAALVNFPSVFVVVISDILGLIHFFFSVMAVGGRLGPRLMVISFFQLNHGCAGKSKSL